MQTEIIPSVFGNFVKYHSSTNPSMDFILVGKVGNKFVVNSYDLTVSDDLNYIVGKVTKATLLLHNLLNYNSNQ